MEQQYNIIERGLTFFECISRSIGNGRDSLYIHDALLFYFMKIIFSNANYVDFEHFCKAIVSNKTRHLVLNPKLITNDAVKQWVKRFAQVEKSVANTPDVWYLAYPKLLKGAMLRFFAYHRNYAQKPSRIYCTNVFAILVADLYNVAVGVSGKACRPGVFKVRWFYPLGAKDYYFQHTLKSIIVASDERGGSGSFCLLQSLLHSVVVPPLLLQPEEEEDDDECIMQQKHPKFVFRISRELKLRNGKKSRSNDQIAEFIELDDDVHICKFEPNEATLEDDLYQIYPGNPAKCYFELGLGEILVIYCIVEKRAIICATHNMNDQYPFFQLRPGTHEIVVVVAKNLTRSGEALLQQTGYSTTIK